MQRCLDLAKLGLAKAAPNPSVGALLVYKDEIISEGYTSAYGGAHAEVNCIENLANKKKNYLSKSTLYVSLEPCSHFGQTPPCSNLIIENNIPKVVIATRDPNPKVAGKGIQKLKDGGIEVIEKILEEEALEVNKHFFTFHLKKRPYITLKWAQTPDGFFSPNNNEQFWITNKKTKALVHRWRSHEMSILVGDKTIIADNPRLNVRLVEGENPIRIIINTKEKLTSDLNIFQDGSNTIIYSFEARKDSSGVSQIKLDESKEILPQIMTSLYEQNINSVFVEGGAFTLQQFIVSNLWDEARILTGSKELESGKAAPKINGKLLEQYTVLEDEIRILKNKA